MLTIDAPPGSLGNFHEVDWIISNHGALKTLITSWTFSSQTKTSDIKKMLDSLHDFLKNNETFSELAYLAFSEGSTYDNWVNQLIMVPKDTFRIAKIEPTDSDSRTYLKIGTHDPLPLKLLRDSLTSESYLNTTKSHWLKRQEHTANASQIRIATAVEIFVQKERSSALMAYSAVLILSDLLKEIVMRIEDKEVIFNHIRLLNEQVSAYNQLNLHELFLPPEQTLESVVIKLGVCYQNTPYQKYQQSLDNLIPSATQLLKIGHAYAHFKTRLPYLTFTSAKISERSKGQYVDLQELYNKGMHSNGELNKALNCAAARVANSIALNDIETQLVAFAPGSTQRKREALNALSLFDSFPLNGSLPLIGMEEEQEIYRSTYLANLIIEAFPHNFYKPAYDVFEVRGRGVHPITDYVSEALHLSKQSMEKIGILNPGAFDATLLNQLYHDRGYTTTKNDHNPLWLFLVIKPINQDFSLLQKIEAYKNVMHMILEGAYKSSAAAHVKVYDLMMQLKNVVLEIKETQPRMITKEVINKLNALELYLEPTFISTVFERLSKPQANTESPQLVFKQMLRALQQVEAKNNKPVPPTKPPRPPKAPSVNEQKSTHSSDEPPLKPPRPPKNRVSR